MKAPEPAKSADPRAATPPAEFDDQVAWAAWLYYVDMLTQNDIAEALRVSRATVVKLLQEARESGAVSIRINNEANARTEASRALSRRFGLQATHIIPELDGAPLTPRLGAAGARVLCDLIEPDDVIGVAWGRTVYAIATTMGKPARPGPFTVVQLYGSSSAEAADFSPELCSSILATRIGARCANLFAPAVLSSGELRDRLVAEPMIVDQFRLIQSCRRVLLGVGELGPTGAVRVSGLTSQDTIDDYVARGAVGVLLGRFIDRDGRPVAGELDSRMVGVTLQDLKTLPNRLCVGGGTEKVEALRAALVGGYVNRLVTDLATARQLMSSP